MGKPWGMYVNGDVKAAWMQARYCPGHREAPEQEFDMVQALSSNEGVISLKDTVMSIEGRADLQTGGLHSTGGCKWDLHSLLQQRG